MIAINYLRVVCVMACVRVCIAGHRAERVLIASQTKYGSNKMLTCSVRVERCSCRTADSNHSCLSDVYKGACGGCGECGACSCMSLPCLFFGVSEDDGTRAYIFVNTWKSLGQLARIFMDFTTMIFCLFLPCEFNQIIICNLAFLNVICRMLAGEVATRNVLFSESPGRRSVAANLCGRPRK